MTEKQTKKFVLSIYPEAYVIFSSSGRVAIMRDHGEIYFLSPSCIFESYAWQEAALLILRKMLEKLES